MIVKEAPPPSSITTRRHGKTHPAAGGSCSRLADHSSNQEGLLPEAAEDDGAQHSCGQDQRQVKGGGGEELRGRSGADQPLSAMTTAGGTTLSRRHLLPPPSLWLSPPPASLPVAVKASGSQEVLLGQTLGNHRKQKLLRSQCPCFSDYSVFSPPELFCSI